MKGRLTALLADDKDLVIMLKVDKAERATLRQTYMRLHEGDVDFEIKKYTEKRTLSANAYMWVLIGKIAEATNIPKDEVYRKHIREMGVYRVIEINNDAAETFITAWAMHGAGWICEKTEIGSERTLINAYYGSSVYSKKQMARLIDSVVQDAVALEIEVKTPDEIAEMISLWQTAEQKH